MHQENAPIVADGTRDFFSQQPLSGETLSERMARSPLGSEEALRLAIEIGALVNHAHSNNQVHGSLSPSSILVVEGRARLIQPNPSPAERAAYRAPEEVRGQRADARSDIFAYGAVLYELATGRRAFPGDGAILTQSILQSPPAPVMTKSSAYIA